MSTAIKNIKKEINPYISFTGGMAQGITKTVYIDRSCYGEFTMASKSKEIFSADLATIIPDGAKILSMKVSNTNGRKLRVSMIADTGLILTGGDASASNQTLLRVDYAPITRFPSVKIEIPDLIAKNIDTANTTQSLFFVATDGATDVVVIKFHYKMAI